MNSRDYNQRVKILAADNKRYTEAFEPMDFEGIEQDGDARRLAVYRNNRFLVQVFKERGIIRLTINRTMIGRDGQWLDGITWDELQEIKDALGFGGWDAVEVYPCRRDIVMDANMRHLWVLSTATSKDLPFVWRPKGALVPLEERKCRVCGCTEGSCFQCIEKTGAPCYWVEEDLCSACVPDVGLEEVQGHE